MSKSAETLAWTLRRLFREMARVSDASLQPLGITAAERALLEFLARESRPVTLSELARKRAVSRQHIHQTLARLDPGWVMRAPDPSDARSVVISLSAQGRSLWSEIRRIDAALFRRVARAVDRDALEAATVTLETIRKTLVSPSGRTSP